MKVNRILLSNTSRATVAKSDGKYSITGIPITVDDVVMNRVKYDKNWNAKGMPTMAGKPLSLSHPADKDGRNISIFSPEGIDFYSGGKVDMPYNKNAVWYVNAVIDEKKLRAASGGEYFAGRLDDGLPIGVSTGLTFESNDDGGDGYDMTAINMNFDHLAMLHESETPAGGDATVMRFNGVDVEVFNVEDAIKNIETIKDDAKEISSLRAAYNALKAKLDTFIAKGYNETDLNINVNENEGSEMTPEEIKAAIAEAVTANAESNKQALVAAVNSAVAPLQEKIATMQESITANADKEKAALVADVVALDIGIDEELAKTMSVNSLNSVIAKNSGKPAGGVTTNGKRKEEEYDAFAMPEFKVQGAK